MKNEDKIMELLSEMLIRQDRFESSLTKMTYVLEKLVPAVDQLGTGLEELSNSQERLKAIQERQEKILVNILEVLADESSMN